MHTNIWVEKTSTKSGSMKVVFFSRQFKVSETSRSTLNALEAKYWVSKSTKKIKCSVYFSEGVPDYIFLCKKIIVIYWFMVKHLPAVQETWVWSLGWEDPLEKEMATQSNILAWRIPWTDEPGRLPHGVADSQTWLND